MVPADNTEGVGLREVINDEEVEEVFAVLRKKEARMPTNWSRRYKNHSEKLRSGDIYQVAEVVRNLSIRDKDKGLSAGEKRMLQRARQILVSELTFALGVDEETAEVSAQRGAALSRPAGPSGPSWWQVDRAAASEGPSSSSPWPAGRWRPGRCRQPGRCPTGWCWWSPVGRGPGSGRPGTRHRRAPMMVSRPKRAEPTGWSRAEGRAPTRSGPDWPRYPTEPT